MHNPNVIILAAGRSKRMGSDKALIEIDGKTVIGRIIDKVIKISNRQIVVCGRNYAKIRCIGLNAKVVLNKNWKNGMFSSLQAGLKLCSKDKWIMLHLIDHPFVSLNTQQKLITEISDEYLVIKPFDERIKKSGHPILLNPLLIDDLLNEDPKSNLKDFLHMLPFERIKYVNVNDKKIYDNINTPEQMHDILKKR